MSPPTAAATKIDGALVSFCMMSFVAPGQLVRGIRFRSSLESLGF